MTTIRRKTKGKQTYYYLEHTYRKNKSILKKELYLGKKIPKDIEEIKKNFLHNLQKEKWHPILEKIKKEFSKDKKNTPPSAKKKQLNEFMIRFTYDTQKIEGSKLTLRETANLLEKGITPKAKPIADSKEAEEHKKIFYEMMNYKKELSLPVVLHWHKKLFHATKPDIAGKIRTHRVGISGSRFSPPFPVEINLLLREFFNWYKINKRLHPVELAALVHLKFVTIHPFADGNGRISRLIMNFILQSHGWPMFDIHYEGRDSYYTALERSQIKNIESIFVNWLMKWYIKEYKKLQSF